MVEEQKKQNAEAQPTVKAKEKVLEALVEGFANEKEEWQLQHWCLEKKLDELYDAYEAGGSIPTKEAFVQMIQEDTEIPEQEDLAEKIKALDPDPFVEEKKKHRKRAGIIAAVIVVILVLCAGGAWLFTQPAESGNAGATAESFPESMTETSEVKLTINAEGVTDASTKAKVKVTNIGEKESTEAIGEMEANANEEISLGVLPKGKYALVITIAPVNEDGTTYELPEKATEFEVKGDREPVALSITLNKLAEENMTEEQLENSAKALESSGKTEAANNVKNKAADKASSSSNSNKGGSSGSSSGNTSSGGSSSSDSTSKPAHTHSWVEQYKNVSTPIYSERIVCSCGDTFSSNAAWSAHNEENLLSGGSGHSYSVKSVQTGTDTQKVVTGYKCSTCGATK